MYKIFTYTNQKFAVPEMQGQAVSTVSQTSHGLNRAMCNKRLLQYWTLFIAPAVASKSQQESRVIPSRLEK